MQECVSQFFLVICQLSGQLLGEFNQWFSLSLVYIKGVTDFKARYDYFNDFTFDISIWQQEGFSSRRVYYILDFFFFIECWTENFDSAFPGFYLSSLTFPSTIGCTDGCFWALYGNQYLIVQRVRVKFRHLVKKIFVFFAIHELMDGFFKLFCYLF